MVNLDVFHRLSVVLCSTNLKHGTVRNAMSGVERKSVDNPEDADILSSKWVADEYENAQLTLQMAKLDAFFKIWDRLKDTPVADAFKYGRMDGNKSCLYWLVKSPWATPDMVKRLIERLGFKDDIDHCTTRKRTALMEAILSRHVHVTKFLVECGANIGARDDTGDTCLHFAARMNSACFGFLLDTRPDLIRDRNCVGATPIHEAASFSWDALHLMIMKLKDSAAITSAINEQDYDGGICLHHAVHFQCTKILKYLLLLGADTSIVNDVGETPGKLSMLLHGEDFVKRAVEELRFVRLEEATRCFETRKES